MSAPSAKSAHANSSQEGICVISEPKGAAWFPNVEPTLMVPCGFKVKKIAFIMSTRLQLDDDSSELDRIHEHVHSLGLIHQIQLHRAVLSC